MKNRDLFRDKTRTLFAGLSFACSYKISIPIFLISFVMFASAVIPLLVTVDGIVYISNAKSLFTDDFASTYTFYREPGYPLLLKIIHFWGDAGVLIVIVQSGLMALAGLIALISLNVSLGLKQPMLWQLLLLWVMLINPMFLGYSGAVLQQALFCFLLAGSTFLVILAIKSKKTKVDIFIISLTLLWYISCISTSIGWLYLGLLPTTAGVSIILIKIFKKRFISRKPNRILNNLVALFLVALTLIGVHQVGRQSYQFWEDYKAPYIEQSLAADDGYVIKPLESIPYVPTPIEMSNRVLSLMNMTVIDPYEKENDLFLGIQSKRQSPSSSWDSAFKGEPQASYALSYFVITNPGEILHNGYSRLAQFAGLGYQICFALLWVTFAFACIKRKWIFGLLLFIGPVNFLLVYAASNSPIDRYGIPAYVFAANALIFLSILISKTQIKARK